MNSFINASNTLFRCPDDFDNAKKAKTACMKSVLMLTKLCGRFALYLLFVVSTLWAANGAHGAETYDQHPVAGESRPAAVPQGFLITPFGYFHPSCVQSLATGERLTADGRIQHADGSEEATAAVCNYPHYTRNGVLLNAGTVNFAGALDLGTPPTVPPEVSGWLENASVTTDSATQSYGALVGTWSVPLPPSVNDGQLLYFFPGLEDINDVQTILQPVMAWYQDQWTIASWNCCINGVTSNSPLVNVKAGDKIYGSITSSCGPGTLSCSTWDVLTVDLTTGKSTILANTPSESQAFNWAFGGVSEPYYVVSCKDYPQGGSLSFTSLTLFDENLHPVAKPAWVTAVDQSATPQCHYAVTDKINSVTVEY